MGYPKKYLSDDEVIVREFRPHWSSILRELLLIILTLVLMGFVQANDWSGWLQLVLAMGLIVLVARGLTRYFTTQHVITNERVIFRTGFISKRGKEIPLEVVNDVAFSQTVFERLLGSGDLLIESAGTHGQSRYRDIPSPEEIQKLIYEVREKRMDLGRVSSGDQAEGESAASQLHKLSELHDAGKLTDEEFEAQKEKLLGDG